MLTLKQLINLKKVKSKKMAAIDLKKMFNKEFNQSLVHQVATDYMSNQRSGTKAQKNR